MASAAIATNARFLATPKVYSGQRATPKPVVVTRRASACRAVSFAAPCSVKKQPANRVVVARASLQPKETPTAIVRIDNMTDPFATIISVEFGDRMGEMLDTITALKNIGLNIRRAKLAASQLDPNCKSMLNKFFITDAETSEKIVKSQRLEEVRLTVLKSLADTYPVGAPCCVTWVKKGVDVAEAPNGSCSLLKIVTVDRPGLLIDIVRVDTIGGQAIDIFFVTYHGEPLSGSMVALTTNSLQYYLSLYEVSREESY
eukprot:gene30150-35128_t